MCITAQLPRDLGHVPLFWFLFFYPAKIKYEIPTRKYSEDVNRLSERKKTPDGTITIIRRGTESENRRTVRTETNITEDEIQDCCNLNVQTIQHSPVPRSFPVLYACKLTDINTCLVLASLDLYDKGSHTKTRGTMTDG